jgi:hypothetical protein
MRRRAKHTVNVFPHKLVVQIDTIQYSWQRKTGLAHALDFVEYEISYDKLSVNRGVRGGKAFEQKISHLLISSSTEMKMGQGVKGVGNNLLGHELLTLVLA